MSEFIQRIEKGILEHRLLADRQALLVAVSGGLDSMVLLQVLYELCAQHHWRLSVAHFNHQLRGRSSDADEKLVLTTAKKLGLPLICERGNVRELAREKKMSIEMAARQLRHEFFARAASEQKSQVLAVAHHADDQVELFFLRLLRGAGVEGLAGMDWREQSPVDPSLTLVRPLLGSTKEQIRGFAKERSIKFREDATNAMLDFQRNRIRHELVPLLKAHYQPALAKVVLRVMDIFNAEDEFVSTEASRWLAQKRRRAFRTLAPALQRRILQLQLRRENLAVDFDLIERLRAVEGEVANINPTLAVFRDEAGLLHTEKIVKTIFNSGHKRVDLHNDGGNVLFDGLRMQWKRREGSGRVRVISQPGREVFDAQRVGSELILRHWQAGDRFQPIGMGASVKLQDLFTNQKILREQRHKLVLATTAKGEIFWIEGLRIGERFKIRKNSKSALQWYWQRLT